EPTPEPTPALTPELTPTLTPELTPALTPNLTLALTPELMPALTPEPAPALAPERGLRVNIPVHLDRLVGGLPAFLAPYHGPREFYDQDVNTVLTIIECALHTKEKRLGIKRKRTMDTRGVYALMNRDKCSAAKAVWDAVYHTTFDETRVGVLEACAQAFLEPAKAYLMLK
ncbi:MAG: hypothetical protein ACO38I_09540, partial [Ilumatobacteraceae bacterium]